MKYESILFLEYIFTSLVTEIMFETWFITKGFQPKLAGNFQCKKITPEPCA